MSQKIFPIPHDDVSETFLWRQWFTDLYNVYGKLSRNNDVGTYDISMGINGEVTQQVGLETYYRVSNSTGVSIPNATVVRFNTPVSGVIGAAPHIADGTIPSLYTIGVTTQAITTGSTGFVTSFGEVHDVNTSAWNVGDILYVSPTVAGALTNVKPTAPNIVIPVAAVVVKDATAGVIFVRPTETLQLYYGSFLCTTSPAIVAANTAYTVPFDTTVASSGITVGTPTSRLVAANAGQYEISISVQALKTSAALGYVWTWVRLNGVDVTNSATRTTLSGSSAEAVVTRSILITLQAGQYIEVCYAADNTATSLISQIATAFAPAAPAVVVSISQVNQ